MPVRPNPYNQTDDEGYLINPNYEDNLWYHFDTSKKGAPPDFEFQMQGFENVAGWYNETYFAGDVAAYEEDLEYGEVFTVKIKIGRDCAIFDARDLFREVPDWVIADITRALNEMEDLHDPQEILSQDDDDAVSQRTLDYLNSGDLGETLNLWRKNEVHLTFRHRNNPDLTWAEWLLRLWMLQFDYVYCVLSEPETFPILDPQITRNIIGWFEREKCDGLSPEWNAISVAVAHNDSHGGDGYIYLPCLDETKIEIVKRDRRYR